jgi:transcriptional regulator with XRE-family HTH domain
MSLISEKFADELTEKRMRDAYLTAQTRTKIVAQIRALRTQRVWSQGEFARHLGKPQSNISQRLENREYGGFTLNTLLELASAFDVGLVVEFVQYADFLRRTENLTNAALAVESFSRASLDPLCHSAPPLAKPAAAQGPAPADFGPGALPLPVYNHPSNTSSLAMHVLGASGFPPVSLQFDATGTDALHLSPLPSQQATSAPVSGATRYVPTNELGRAQQGSTLGGGTVVGFDFACARNPYLQTPAGSTA